MSRKKRNLGQYYTEISPFNLTPFQEWINKIPQEQKQIIIEPFAGSCNIPCFLNQYKFDCFDIDPPENTNRYIVHKIDSIENYPKGYCIAITNPPYLGKSSASRRHLEYKYPEYEDLYFKCLEVMLDNTDYVAAIIPDSFITSGRFTERLDTAISLSCPMFNDTDCPVCLALFNSQKTDDFKYYIMNVFCGTYSTLKLSDVPKVQDFGWEFNNVNGEIGLVCIDNTIGPSIHFIPGEDIKPESIKISSRALTRIQPTHDVYDIDQLIKKSNDILYEFRNDTYDLFLTSFKGLRRDGKYRRRITFEQARRILNFAESQNKR